MIKKIFAILLIGMCTSELHAQYVFDNGSLGLNGGVGFFSMDGDSPSINLSGELGLLEIKDLGIISFGGIMEFKSSEINGQNYKQLIIGPRANWHFQFPFLNKTKFDLYAGIGAGLHRYRNYNLTTFVYDPTINPYFETFLGSRYMFNEKWGAFIEAGYGAMATLKAGIAYHLVILKPKKTRYYPTIHEKKPIFMPKSN